MSVRSTSRAAAPAVVLSLAGAPAPRCSASSYIQRLLGSREWPCYACRRRSLPRYVTQTKSPLRLALSDGPRVGEQRPRRASPDERDEPARRHHGARIAPSSSERRFTMNEGEIITAPLYGAKICECVRVHTPLLGLTVIFWIDSGVRYQYILKHLLSIGDLCCYTKVVVTNMSREVTDMYSVS